MIFKSQAGPPAVRNSKLYVPVSGWLQALYGWEHVIILCRAAKTIGHSRKAEAILLGS